MRSEKYLFNSDMLEVLPVLPSMGFNPTMVFADLPYGKTANKWDLLIDLKLMWKSLPDCTCLFTASNGFEFVLFNSNPEEYKYKWVWNKNNSAGFHLAKRRPLNVTEDILVFRGSIYNPQMEVRGKIRRKGGYKGSVNLTNKMLPTESENNTYYPKSLINISNNDQKQKRHPTQKPIELLEYLIQTYTNPGDLVLDPCMGSGSTGEACFNTGRSFIGIEKDKSIFRDTEEYLEPVWNSSKEQTILDMSDI